MPDLDFDPGLTRATLDHAVSLGLFPCGAPFRSTSPWSRIKPVFIALNPGDRYWPVLGDRRGRGAFAKSRIGVAMSQTLSRCPSVVRLAQAWRSDVIDLARAEFLPRAGIIHGAVPVTQAPACSFSSTDAALLGPVVSRYSAMRSLLPPCLPRDKAASPGNGCERPFRRGVGGVLPAKVCLATRIVAEWKPWYVGFICYTEGWHRPPAILLLTVYAIRVSGCKSTVWHRIFFAESSASPTIRRS